MAQLLPLLLLALIWALGDFLSTKSKSIISMVTVALVVLLILKWTGVVQGDLVDKAGLTGVAVMSIPLVLVHMGSSINAKQLKQEWKTVVVCLGVLIVLVAVMFTIGSLILGKNLIISATPTLYGGAVASIIMSTATKGLGMGTETAFIWIVQSVQIFVGVPIGLWFLKKFLKKVLKKDAVSTLSAEVTPLADNGETLKPSFLQEKYQTSFILLFLVILIATFATWVGGYTNKYVFIHSYIVCLIFGFLAAQFRIIPRGALAKANAYGFLIFAMFLWIGSFVVNSISLESFLALIKPTIIFFAIGVPVMALGGAITAKILKWDPWLGAAISTSCLFGFPTTIILAQEAAKGISRNEEERKIFEDYLVPKMLIAGLVTVSLVSGIAASLLVGLL